MQWCSGSACIVVDGLILWRKKNSSCGMHELIQHMNSYIWWIQYEFIYFLHFKYMNSYKYEFILCMISYIFAVIMYEFIYFLQCKIKAASVCEPQARAVSAQCELRARSTSREGEARAHLLPQPDRARLPWLLGLHAAAPIVRVHTAAPIVRVACGCPNS